MYIESKLVLDNPVLSAFYYYCREQDVEGRGWIHLSMDSLVTFFGKTKRTVVRWVRLGLKKGFFYQGEITKGSVYIKYVSKEILKDRTGGCHAKTKVTLEILKQVSCLKAIAYEAALISQQLRCQGTVERLNSGNKKSYIPKRSKKRSGNAQGCDYVSFRGTHFVKTCRTAVGASQITVAAKLGRSRSTLQRNTKHIERNAIYQGVKKEDRPGLYYEFRKAKFVQGFPTEKVKLYRKAPSYYHSDIDVQHEKTIKVDTNYAQYARKVNEAALDKEKVEFILSQRGIGIRDFGEFLHTQFVVVKLRKLANAILWHFKQRVVPAIDTMVGVDLANMIINLEEAMTIDEWRLIKLMARRLKKGKLPLPYGTAPGALLQHLTAPATKLQYSDYHNQFDCYSH